MIAPKLRFPGFQDEWKSAKAGDAFYNRREKGASGLPIYSVTLDRGMVPRETLERQLTSDAADEDNLRAQQGDLVYNMMRMWQGAVGMAPVECMVSPAYVVLAPKDETSSQFFEYWFKSGSMLYKLWAYSHGLTSDRLRLYYNDFAQIPVRVPGFSEQKKIAGFLTLIDKRLQQLGKRRELLTCYKKGLMSKIFDRELRFKDDDGKGFPAWEKHRFGDVFGWVKTNNLAREHLTFETGIVQNIHYGDIHTRFRPTFRQAQEKIPFIATATLDTFSSEEYCRVGDVVIADASEDYADIGKAIEIVALSDNPLVAGLHTYIARPKIDGLVTGFSGYLLRSAPMRKQIIRVAQGVSVLGISKSNLAELTFWLPHPDEQRKISHAISAVDTKIDAVGSQLRQLSDFKRGLLQQMFV